MKYAYNSSKPLRQFWIYIREFLDRSFSIFWNVGVYDGGQAQVKERLDSIFRSWLFYNKTLE